ncbi:MAG TPA: hypothetical protein VMK16_01485 [Acidimicrobiales bacterium]|nr:hypothetical protein [Acidimicrobiales bacterium]
MATARSTTIRRVARHRRLLLASVCAIASLVAGTRANAACHPGADQAAFFVDANFQGACVVKNVGNFANSGSIGLPNDSISSLEMGANVQVIVCKDDDFGGDCILLTHDVGFLNDHRVGNDQVSSLRVQALGTSQCVPAANQVSFFTNADFLGSCVVKDIGEYPNSGVIGLPNDSISSVRIGAGAQAVVCKDTGFLGDCILLDRDVAFLNGPRVGNDEVSSAKVQAAGTTSCQPGDGQVAFFVDADFLGSCVVKDVGDYPSAETIGLPNDSISSIRVGNDAQAILCTDAGFKGDCILLTSSTSFIHGDRVDNDQITSARVQPRGQSECTPTDNQVALYMHADFLGPCVVKGIGQYRNSAAIGLDDKSISSVRIGTGAQACLCSLEQWQGDCHAITASTPFLGNATPPSNDWASSVKVQAQGAACVAESGSTTQPQGYSQLAVRNCHSEGRAIHLWTRDVTIGAPWVEQGTLAAGTSGEGCEENGPLKTVTLTDGHQIDFVAVDPGQVACGGQNDPQAGQCQRSALTQPIAGAKNGPSWNITVY